MERSGIASGKVYHLERSNFVGDAPYKPAQRRSRKSASMELNMEFNYFDYRSLYFIRNLLVRHPTIFRNLQDLPDFMAFLKRALTDDEVDSLKSQIVTFATRHSIHEESKQQELLAYIFDNDFNREFRGFVQKRSKEFTSIILPAIEKHLSTECEDIKFNERLLEIQKSFSLSDKELEVIELLTYSENNWGGFNDNFSNDELWERTRPHFLAYFLDMPLQELTHILRTDGTLLSLGFIQFDSKTLKVGKALEAYLGMQTKETSFLHTVFEDLPKNASHGLPKDISEADELILQSLMQDESGCHVLFHGASGAGKTTFAQRLAQVSGRKAFFLKQSEDGEQKERWDLYGWAIAILKKQNDAILIVDEADQMFPCPYSYLLSGTKSDKGKFNRILEAKDVKVIWIANSIKYLPPECLRRFAYSIRFEALTASERADVWRNVLRERPLFSSISEDEIRSLSRRYDLEPAHVVDSVRHVTNLRISPQEAPTYLERYLESQIVRLGKEDSLMRLVNEPDKRISLTGLTTDFSLPDVLEVLRGYISTDPKTRPPSAPRNLNLLLSGPPGTGKTQFAKFAAKELGVPVHIKAASDLLSMWVGMTEKNIAKAFKEAEKDKALLFIDEADTFLQSREGSRQSWEISHVNEFLCQMERFQGILICASNFMDRFDSAAMRRFPIKLKFDWLRPDGIQHFFNLYFKELVPSIDLGAEEKRRLERISYLTPGDFKAVFDRLYYLPKAHLTAAKVIETLENEVAYKKIGSSRPIGFA